MTAPSRPSDEPRRSLSLSLVSRARSLSLGRGRPPSQTTDRRSESHAPPASPTSLRRRNTLGHTLRHLIGRKPDLVGPQHLPRAVLERPLPPLPPPETPPPAYSEGERRRRERRDRPPAYDKPAVIMPKGLGLDLDFSIDEGERLARHLERDRSSVDL